MFSVIYIPTGTVVSEHTDLIDAQLALSVAETTPPTHEIIGTPEPEPVEE